MHKSHISEPAPDVTDNSVMSDFGLSIPGLACACGATVIVAVAPGTEGETAPDLFTITRDIPTRAWCAACWPALRRPA